MDVNRKSFIDECRADFEECRKDNKLLIHYVLDRKGRRIGVLVAAKPSDAVQPMMGWSLCNIKRDSFNKYIGLVKALDRLQYGNPMIDDETFFFPTSIQADLVHFADRIERYFNPKPKTEDVPKVEG
jgi:hypothetical protein